MQYGNRGRRMAYGLPVYTSSVLPNNIAAYTGDFTKAVVAYRRSVRIDVSVSNRDEFEDLIVSIRASVRGVLGVPQPKAIAKIPWTGAAL